MATKPDIEASELHWADGVDAEVETPVEQRRLKGHELYKPSHAHMNWFWKYVGWFIQWLTGETILRYESVTAGIAATSPGDIFTVGSASQHGRAEIEGSDHAAARCRPVTDGRLVYTTSGTYAAYGSTVYAHHPSQLHVDLWSLDVLKDISSMCADGAYLYLGHDSASGSTKVSVLTTAGALVDVETGAYSDEVFGISSNGTYVVFARGNFLEIRDAGDLGNADSYDHGATITWCCCDDKYAYYIGAAGVGGSSAGDDVVCVALETGAYVWGVTLNAGAGVHVCCDGNNVYVIGDDSTYQIWCLDRITGAYLWRAAKSTGDNPTWSAVDGDTLYAAKLASGSQSMYALDKRSGSTLWVMSAADLDTITGFCADGAGVYVDGVIDGADLALVYAHKGEPARFFARVDGDDIARRPFHNLALPI